MWDKITYPFSNFNGCTVEGKVWSSSVICVTNQPSVSDWVVQVPLWPSGLGVGLWNRLPGFDPRTVRYICISWFGNLSSRLHVSNSGTRTLFDWRRVVFAFHSCNIRIVWGLWSQSNFRDMTISIINIFWLDWSINRLVVTHPYALSHNKAVLK